MNNKIKTVGYGSLFKQKTKTNATQPDFVGKIIIDGVTQNLAGWIKPTKTGDQYISIKVSEISQSKFNTRPEDIAQDDMFKPIKVEMSNDDLPF